MTGLPAGTVTLLFTDIEGSTRLLLRLGTGYPAVLETHRRLLTQAVEAANGTVLDTQGDASFCVFSRASEGVAAAAEIQRSLAAYPWPDDVRVRVRLGVHTGEPTVTQGGYAGLDVHRAARICSAGHGGQILVSSTTADLVETTLPADLSLVELGSFRFKDFTFAERVYQLNVQGLPTGFPPPRTLEVGNKLPGQHRSMIGREREVEACRRLLLDPTTRLVTLTGAGGSGKTRLAVAVAEGLHDAFDDGICFVPLASVTDPGRVAIIIAQALGVRDVSSRASDEILVDVLGGRDQLLVLDNFEQVLDAAPLVAELLLACPRLKILATSREPLHLTGERELSVQPLELPPPDLDEPKRIYELAAPKLFVERAREAKRDFEAADADAPTIAEICRRLDGLPLAIELAAARIRFLSPSALLARLDRRLAVLTGGPRDLPARQQTLRATIAWSHDLLEERDRIVFRRAAVFVNGWSLEAAEAVCGPTGTAGGTDAGPVDDPLATVDALSSLVDKNLLRREELPDGDARFSMFATIRELAQEQLEAAGEQETTLRRHAEYFLSVAEEAAPHLALDASQLEWLAHLDREEANLQAAFDWSRAGADDPEWAETGLRLGAALWPFWAVRNSAAEAREHIEAILALSAAGEATSARGRALHGASVLARELSDYDASERLLSESLEIARRHDDPREVADVLASLGWLSVLRGDLAGARALLEESLRLFQRLGDVPWKGRVMTRLGYVCFMEGMYPQAMAFCAEAATIARVIGDQRVLAEALIYLGIAEQYAGDLSSARRRYEEGLPMARTFGDRHLIGMTLNMLGQLAVLQEAHHEARRLLREALGLAREVGNVRRLSIVLRAVATLAKGVGEPDLAVRFDAAAAAAAQSVGTARARAASAISEQVIAEARAAIGETSAALAAEDGRRLPLDRAVDEALAWLGEGDAGERDDANAARWQEPPWTVFGWNTDPSPAGPEMEVGGSATRVGGSVQVFGEGGTLPPR